MGGCLYSHYHADTKTCNSTVKSKHETYCSLHQHMYTDISLQFKIVESIYDVAVDILTYTVDKIRNRINLLFFCQFDSIYYIFAISLL